MRLDLSRNLCNLILSVSLLSSPIAAQNLRVTRAKSASKIPEPCLSVVPAPTEGLLDIPALIKEAMCKGAGDMLSEYTYVMKAGHREKSKKGEIKEETTTYEVFIPTLKGGMHTRGVLLVTSRNGVAVPPEELEKEQLKTGERLEKEEDKISRANAPSSTSNLDTAKGILPLGVYTAISVKGGAFAQRGGARLSIEEFLQTCNFTLLKREQKEGREALIFRFAPRPDAKFDDGNKYIAHITGEIWIDATDRIVTRLVGWPRGPQEANAFPRASSAEPAAVYFEMVRLREGIWFPRLKRINGLDYPALFDRITFDSTFDYSNFIHFSTEIIDYKIKSSKTP